MFSLSAIRRTFPMSARAERLHPCFVALLLGAAACGTGTIGPSTGAGTSTSVNGGGAQGGAGGATSTGTAGGGSTPGTTGAAAPGATANPQALVPSGVPSGYGWFESLEAATCSTAATPPT